jgi:Fe2+ transport system protein B
VGYVIFFVILFVIFQSIFEWSNPMDFIDSTFASLSTLANNELPAGVLTNLVSQGIIPGIMNSDFHSTNCLLVSIYFPFRRKWLYE